MKRLKDIALNEAKGEWCLWDYEYDGYHEILIWKNNGKDQSQVADVDENGKELMNVPFEDVINYCKIVKKDMKVDKWHLDFENANWDKIKDIF